MFEISKEFRFEAAHTLQRSYDAEKSRRIHGHSYRARVVVRGLAGADSGMVIDFGEFEHLLENVRGLLDHMFLDEIEDLGPATLESLSAWIWRRLAPHCAGLVSVSVSRDSEGEACTYFGLDRA